MELRQVEKEDGGREERKSVWVSPVCTEKGKAARWVLSLIGIGRNEEKGKRKHSLLIVPMSREKGGE